MWRAYSSVPRSLYRLYSVCSAVAVMGCGEQAGVWLAQDEVLIVPDKFRNRGSIRLQARRQLSLEGGDLRISNCGLLQKMITPTGGGYPVGVI